MSNSRLIKMCFFDKIRNDPWILHQMPYYDGEKLRRLDDATDLQIARRILRRRMNLLRLDDKNWYINIYFCSSKKCANSSFLQHLIQVDILVPASCSDIADEIISRIVKLCTAPNFKIYGGVPDLDSLSETLSSPHGFYRAGAKFSLFLSKS